MTGPTALLDSNVLYSACVRNLVLWLARYRVYRPLWSERIQNEWSGKLLENRSDLKRAQMDHTIGQMNEHFGDAAVTEYEHLAERVRLPDPKDHHVLAAAIQGGADFIVTWNLKHFPLTATRLYGIEPRSPDEFVFELLVDRPDTVVTAVRRHRHSLRNPPRSTKEHLRAYEAAGLSKVAARLKRRTSDL